MAALAVHDRGTSDAVFQAHLERVVRAATDERTGVKKASTFQETRMGTLNRLPLGPASAGPLALSLRESEMGSAWYPRPSV
jgi:hypothetical protein